MMKIGIITFYRPINIGAVLQATATNRIVFKDENIKTELIDYRLPRTEFYRKPFNLLRPFKAKGIKNMIRAFVAEFLFFPKRLKVYLKISKFVKRHLIITDKKYKNNSDYKGLNESFDAFLIGSDLDNFEKNKGISLILINTDKGNELIPSDEVFLKDANIEESVKAQGQLQSPSRFPTKRNLFIEKISSGHGYHKVIKKIYYKKIIVSCFRNIPFVYYVYRKIKPPSFSSYISYSLEKRKTELFNDII